MRRWWLLGLALLCSACVAPAPAPRETRGPVFAGERGAEALCVVEEMPNYLLHLTALAGLPYRSTYADRFGHTVDAESAQILNLHAPMLQWGQGVTGDLAPFFVLLPAYLPMEDEYELFEYLRAVDEAMRSRDYSLLRDPYYDAHEELRQWLFDYEGFFRSRAAVYDDFLRAIRQLVFVYEHSFQDYHEKVWSEVELDLDLAADDLNGELWSLELIDSLESMTGVRLRADRYEIVLTTAPGGTGVTGLGYARSLMTVSEDRDHMLGLIVHEVAMHLLVGLFREAEARDVASGELDWTTYAAYAGLAQHYTRLILPGFETQIENDVAIFAGIYRQLQDQEPKAGARRLMERALREFREGKW
jgi:hypothetical protein